MTRIGKCLVVFTAVASLLFLGVVAAQYAGGPNWEAQRLELSEFDFEKSEGDTPTWTVRTRLPLRGPDGRHEMQTVTSGAPSLPDAIVKTREFKNRNQRDEIERLDRQIPAVETRLQEARELIETDLEAMRKREAQLVEQLDALYEDIEETSKQSVAQAQEAQELRAEAENRREDVFRLRNQLAELRTDKYRAIRQQEQLRDLLIRVNGSNERLERRKEQLQAAGAQADPAEVPYEEDPPVPAPES